MLQKFKIMKRIKLCFLFIVSSCLFCLSGQAQDTINANDRLILELLEKFDEFENAIEKDSVFAYEIIDYNTLVKKCDDCWVDYKRDSVYYHTEPNLKQFIAYLRKKYYY